MHENYDVVYCAGEAYKEVLAEGFNMSPSKFHVCTLPRIDLLFDEKYQNDTKEKISKEIDKFSKSLKLPSAI